MERLTAELFNTYVQRSGDAEPYYTEYCDGRTVTCPGMKQWGTVERAKEGKNALQITTASGYSWSQRTTLHPYRPAIRAVRCAAAAAGPMYASCKSSCPALRKTTPPSASRW